MCQDIIKSEDYEKELKGILPKYDIPVDNLYFEDKLPYPTQSPYTAAQADRIERKIYILKVLKQDNLDAGLHKIPLNELNKRRINVVKNDNWLCLKHILLHEVCEILYPTWEDDARRDEWAFKEMGL